jgi:hypothetical protein
MLIDSYRVVQHRIVYGLGWRLRWWRRSRVHDEFHPAVWAHSGVPTRNQPAAEFRVKEPTTGDGNTFCHWLAFVRVSIKNQCRRFSRDDLRFRQDPAVTG